VLDGPPCIGKPEQYNIAEGKTRLRLANVFNGPRSAIGAQPIWMVQLRKKGEDGVATGAAGQLRETVFCWDDDDHSTVCVSISASSDLCEKSLGGVYGQAGDDSCSASRYLLKRPTRPGNDERQSTASKKTLFGGGVLFLGLHTSLHLLSIHISGWRDPNMSSAVTGRISEYPTHEQFFLL
jgi:hypothetical protein